MKIPKILHQIWIGDLPPPQKWLDSWKEKHPDWKYVLWTNKELENIKWINQRIIDIYKSRKQWAGVADCMRYEILYKFGGVMMGADYVCENNIEELFENDYEAFAIDTSKITGLKAKKANKYSCSPLLACTPKNKVALELIKRVNRIVVIGKPVKTVGNRLMQKVVPNFVDEIKIFPLHYFIPEHFNGWKYEGSDKTYAKHYWGTTRGNYGEDYENVKLND